MSFEGTIVNGQVVFADPVPLPDGTCVEVVVKAPAEAASELGAMLLRHAGKADGLPPDTAAQHDHYLYGTPKR
jgi:hypothetical protein